MAKKSRRKTRRVIQRQSRQRATQYRKYVERTERIGNEPLSYREWKEEHYKSIFRKRYEEYKDEFLRRKAAAESGRGIAGTRGFHIETMYDFRDFKDQYLLTRNTLEEEVVAGEREKVGSVITEMINDQAYELSYAKARGVASYLIENELDLLVEKNIAIPTGVDEKGQPTYKIKNRTLNLLIRQGDFVNEEVGLWDTIKDHYKKLKDAGLDSYEAKKEIGRSYFKS